MFIYVYVFFIGFRRIKIIFKCSIKFVLKYIKIYVKEFWFENLFNFFYDYLIFVEYIK